LRNNGKSQQVGALGVVLIGITLMIAWMARGLLSRGLQTSSQMSS